MSDTTKEGAPLPGGPLLALIAIAALGAVIVSAALVFTGGMSLSAAKTSMLVGTIVWFVAGPVWLLRGQADGDV